MSKRINSSFTLFLLALAPNCAYSQANFGRQAAWLPVTAEERAMAQPAVDKDAGVEALFWRVHLADEFQGQDLSRGFYHYIRLKVFNEKGKEDASKIEIVYGKDTAILYIQARTILPDGTIIELKGDDVHERDQVKSGGRKVKVKSFAMPGVVPGAIVEYRYLESQHNPRILYNRLDFQREVPVQKVTYYLKPLPSEYTTYGMGVRPFSCRPTPLNVELDGYNSTTLTNVEAFKSEPYMPGEATVRKWVLVFYSNEDKRNPDKYWNKTGKEIYSEMKSALKADDKVKAAVAQASSDEEKVLGLLRYLRKNVRNLFGSQVTEAERSEILRKMPKQRHRTASEIFKTLIGTPNEMNTLFAAMASAVGLDARPALVGDRSDIPFSPALADAYFLPHVDMAVLIGGKWKLYDVSTKLLPPHMLSWAEEGTPALLSDPKEPKFIESPVSPPKESLQAITGNMTLTADGTLAGDVEEQFTGHTAAEQRRYLFDEAEAKRLDLVNDRILNTFSSAEVTGIEVSGVEDAEKPLKFVYKIKIPGYAQVVGRRLILQPLFNRKGDGPKFAASTRKYYIQFPYAWQESDSITIALPAGYTLETPDYPEAANFGAPGGFSLQAKLLPGGKVAITRELVFGGGGYLGFKTEVYGQVKQVFDEIHRRDNLSISLQRAASGSVGAGGQ